MDIDTLNFLLDEADEITSPQLRGATASASSLRPSSAPSELALIVALVAELEASEARARHAEGLLAAHGRHCICRAGEIAAEEAMEFGSAWMAEAVGDLPLSLAA